MSESLVLKRAWLRASKLGARLFRNNTGQAWVGVVVSRTQETITLKNYRPFHAGLCVGSTDLIGYLPIVVTQAMVGKKLAIFTAPEIKTDIRKTKATDDQDRFINAVSNAGGIAGVIRSEEDMEKLLAPYI